MKTSTRYIACALVAAATVAVFWQRGRDVAATERTATTHDAPIDASGSAVTWRKILELHWGAEWPALEARLSKEQEAALEQRIDPDQVPRWEIVAPTIREKLRQDLQQQRADWGKRFQPDDDLELSGERLNPARRELGASERESVRAIVDQYGPEIEAIGQQAFDLTVEAEESIWDNGLYRAYPLLEFPVDDDEPSAGRLVLMRKWVTYPWVVRYTIDSSKWPDLEAAVTRLIALRARRDLQIRAYITRL